MSTTNTTFAPLNTIISWFAEDAQPSEQQFETTWKSFFHKSENIPVEQIYQLTEILNLKAEREHLHLDLAKKDGSNLDVDDINGLKEVLGVALAANGIIGNIETTITTEAANLLQDGIYKPKTTGVYSSIGLTAKENYTTLFKKLDGVWSIFSEEKLPTLSPTGKVEENNTEAVSGGEVFKSLDIARTNYNILKENLVNNVDFLELTNQEIELTKILKRVVINNYNNDLKLILNIESGIVTELRFDNLTDTTHFIMTNSLISNDNGLLHYNYNSMIDGKAVSIQLTLDLRGVNNFYYSYGGVNDNLLFNSNKNTFETNEFINQNSIISLTGDNFNGKLLNNTMYYKFTINEPIILGSISLNVIKLPTNNNQVNFVEVAIYPMDNGYGTAQVICKSRPHNIYKLGNKRIPLEQKVLEIGTYAIGIKTNCIDSFKTKSGVDAYRGYDGGNLMPDTAINYNYPNADKYHTFPEFTLYENKTSKIPNKHHSWKVEFEPEYSFLGTRNEDNNNLIYLREEDDISGKLIRFYRSIDGGITKTQITSNNILPNDYNATYGSLGTCVEIMQGSDIVIFCSTAKGFVLKFVVSGGISTMTDITPPNKSESINSMPVASYAPLVIFKNYLFWGEYQDPATPRLHKMNITTGVWSISIEKSRSGVNGARHVHFIYKSPVNSNVLWAVWGDASNGGGQGLNKLEASSLNDSPDSWVQWTTGINDVNGTTLPYPTAILEFYEGINGILGQGESVIIGAGDQPNTHLIKSMTQGIQAGKYLFEPLNFKKETSPSSETCHWLAMDENRTIYYMSQESNPYLSIYASPYPYNNTFRVSKFWQQAVAGNIIYSNGYVITRYYRFAKIDFINKLDVVEISKLPYVGVANSSNIVEQFNKLLTNLQGSNLLQFPREIGNDKNASNWVDNTNQFENWN
ncbi:MULTISPECIES: hypothetical protein [unclassified Empedobacter]|uniref:hypothetical protein n=1 Tax=unclassified Empedobacter TaxID=2643773 RepID=UPI0025C4E561|nr:MULTISPECIES: hypothetical protein [unclassified Empedobacter]